RWPSPVWHPTPLSTVTLSIRSKSYETSRVSDRTSSCPRRHATLYLVARAAPATSPDRGQRRDGQGPASVLYCRGSPRGLGRLCAHLSDGCLGSRCQRSRRSYLY